MTGRPLSFASWCVLRRDYLRRRLDALEQDRLRAMMIREHRYGWWSHDHSRGRQWCQYEAAVGELIAAEAKENADT